MKDNPREIQFFSYMKSIFRDTSLSVEQNSMMGMASILSVVASLIILGIFVIFSINLDQITQSVEEALELKVFVKKDITQEELETLEMTLASNGDVASVRFESADEALANFSESLDDYSALLNGYDSENNPMTPSFIIKAVNPDKLHTVKNFAASLKDEGVEQVKYGEEYVDMLMTFSQFSSIFSVVMGIILTGVSVFIIYNTIKLTCFARRREIRVMRYVGASDWYIRFPFFLEGAFLGVMGALVAMLLIRTSYLFMIAYVDQSVYIPMDTTLVAPNTLMGPISLFCIVYGIVIGASGSLFSIRKFLDV